MLRTQKYEISWRSPRRRFFAVSSMFSRRSLVVFSQKCSQILLQIACFLSNLSCAVISCAVSAASQRHHCRHCRHCRLFSIILHFMSQDPANPAIKSHSTLLPYIILIFLSLIWGSSFILMKRGLAVFAPAHVAALRMIIAAVVLLPVSVVALRRVDRRLWKYLLVVGLLGSGLPALLFSTAQTGINSSSAGLLNTTTPLFTLLLGTMLFQLRPTRAQIVGVLVGLVGAVILVLGASKEAPSGSPLYALLILLATVCYGLSTNTIGRYLKSVPPLYANSLVLLPIAPLYALYVFALGTGADAVAGAGANTGAGINAGSWADFLQRFAAHSPEQSWQALAAVALLAVLGTALSNIVFVYLIRMSSVLFASSVTYLIPIVALLWGIADGEQLRWQHLAGVSIILVGIFLASRTSTAVAAKNNAT
jgi:drug/metabolite transporter (DMT)-like permease